MKADYLVALEEPDESEAGEPLIGLEEGPKHAVLTANTAPNPINMRMVFFMDVFLYF